jgi:two-component system response regulator
MRPPREATSTEAKPVEILLAEDRPGDVGLTKRAFEKGKLLYHLTVTGSGTETLEYLRKEGKYANSAAPLPDLILLDLNLPGLDGREVLAIIKGDDRLSYIPVIVMTISQEEEDVWKAYKLQANCYITKPVNWNDFMNVIAKLEEFWFTVVRLPRR